VKVVADSLGLDELRVIETGGDVYATERQQWDSGTTWFAARPGVVIAYDRNIHQHRTAPCGHRGHRDRRCRARPGPWRRPLHDLPLIRDAVDF